MIILIFFLILLTIFFLMFSYIVYLKWNRSSLETKLRESLAAEYRNELNAISASKNKPKDGTISSPRPISHRMSRRSSTSAAAAAAAEVAANEEAERRKNVVRSWKDLFERHNKEILREKLSLSPFLSALPPALNEVQAMTFPESAQNLEDSLDRVKDYILTFFRAQIDYPLIFVDTVMQYLILQYLSLHPDATFEQFKEDFGFPESSDMDQYLAFRRRLSETLISKDWIRQDNSGAFKGAQRPFRVQQAQELYSEMLKEGKMMMLNPPQEDLRGVQHRISWSRDDLSFIPLISSLGEIVKANSVRGYLQSAKYSPAIPCVRYSRRKTDYQRSLEKLNKYFQHQRSMSSLQKSDWVLQYWLAQFRIHNMEEAGGVEHFMEPILNELDWAKGMEDFRNALFSNVPETLQKFLKTLRDKLQRHIETSEKFNRNIFSMDNVSNGMAYQLVYDPQYRKEKQLDGPDLSSVISPTVATIISEQQQPPSQFELSKIPTNSPIWDYSSFVTPPEPSHGFMFSQVVPANALGYVPGLTSKENPPQQNWGQDLYF